MLQTSPFCSSDRATLWGAAGLLDVIRHHLPGQHDVGHRGKIARIDSVANNHNICLDGVYHGRPGPACAPSGINQFDFVVLTVAGDGVTVARVAVDPLHTLDVLAQPEDVRLAAVELEVTSDQKRQKSIQSV